MYVGTVTISVFKDEKNDVNFKINIVSINNLALFP